VFLDAHQIPFAALRNDRKLSYASPTQAEIELIRKLNSLDIALWEWWKNQASIP